MAGAIPRVAALVWLQAVLLAAGWACASLAAVTGLLVVARLGHPEARLWCVPLPLVCLGMGGLGAALPLVHPRWLGARLGLRPARQERRLPRLPDDPVTGL